MLVRWFSRAATYKQFQFGIIITDIFFRNHKRSSRSWIKFKSPMLNGWRPNFGYTGLLSGQSGLWRNQRARKEKAQELRSDLHALRVQGRAAVRRGACEGARAPCILRRPGYGRRIPKGARENSLKNKTKLGWACGGGWGPSASLFCGLLGIVTL